MSIIGLIVWILLIGLVVWIINTYTPIPSQFKTLILVVGLIAAILLVLHAFGFIGAMNTSVPTVG
jgi:hypothetical protein